MPWSFVDEIVGGGSELRLSHLDAALNDDIDRAFASNRAELVNVRQIIIRVDGSSESLGFDRDCFRLIMAVEGS